MLELKIRFFQIYLKVLNFAGTKFRDFHDFWPFSRNFVPAKSFKTKKSQN